MACRFHVLVVSRACAHATGSPQVDRPGGIVRKLVNLAVATTAVLGIACGRAKSPRSTSMSADLRRDLQLASATPDIQISPDEVAPQAHKPVALRTKRAPDGPKVIR